MMEDIQDMKEGEHEIMKSAFRKSEDCYIKIKAVMQIFLVISLIFIVSINSKEVKAEDNQLYCCQEDTQGNYCQQYESQGQCKEGTLEFSGPCSALSTCKPGCCDLTNSESSNFQDLSCYPNVGIQSCSQYGGEWRTDGNCGYEQCQQACCKVGTQCTISTKSGCEQLTNRYNLELDYKTEITDETECQNVCRTEEKGCCVVENPGENNNCGYKTFQECQSANGQFTTGEYCSSLEEQCGQCKAKARLGCLEGSDKIYWYDSCGNIEGEATSSDAAEFRRLGVNDVFKESNNQNCDYAQGTMCKADMYTDNDGNKQAGCKNVNCFNTEENKNVIYDNPFVDENGNCITEYSSGIVPPTADCWTDDNYDQNNPRKNGESWCEYISNAGPGLDLPGSQHYAYSCVNGEVQIDPCGEYRDKFCGQVNIVDESDTRIQTKAKCLPNLAIDCGSQKNKYDCENKDARTCLWLSNNEETYVKANEQIQEYGKEINQPSEDTDGICIPLVPPGINQKEDDGALCDQADTKKGGLIEPIKTKWIEGGHETDCEAGCSAFTRTFSYQLNDLCNSMGDCGAKYNLAGKWTYGGYERTFKINKEDFGLDEDADILWGLGDGYDPGDVKNTLRDYKHEEIWKLADEDNCDKDEALDNGDDCAGALIKAAENSNTLKNIDRFDETKISRSFVGLYKNYGDKLTFSSDVSDLVNFYGLGQLAIIGGAGAIGIVIVITPFISALIVKALAVAGVVASIPVAGWIAAAVILIVTVIVALVTWPEEKTVTINSDCKIWQPPQGAENCNLCHEAGYREYLVTSESECPINAHEGNEVTSIEGSSYFTCKEWVDFTAGGKQECTQYRCQSLGQGCEYQETDEGKLCLDTGCSKEEELQPPFVSIKNTEELKQKCKDQEKDDTGNTIGCTVTPTEGKQATAVFEIQNYVKANSDLNITIQTCKDENCEQPMYSSCKWDTEKKEKYEDMSNSFKEGAVNSAEHKLELKSGIDLISENDRIIEKTIYVRCSNRCGSPEINKPSAFQEIKLKVAQSKDIEPVQIREINPVDNGKVANEKLNNEQVPFFVEIIPNKQVENCAYSKLNVDYQHMQNVTCSVDSTRNQQICTLPLSNLQEGDNMFFIKCLGMNKIINQQSLPDADGYNLIGTSKLVIDSIKCLQKDGTQSCGEIQGDKAEFNVYGTNFTLHVNTNQGADQGKAICKMTSWIGSVPFFETGEAVHTQLISRQTETQKIETFECTDSAENKVRGELKYILTIDRKNPKITKIYAQDGTLYVETDEQAICKYSTQSGSINYNSEKAFAFERTGDLVHSNSINEDNHFKVICRDTNDNDSFAEIYV